MPLNNDHPFGLSTSSGIGDVFFPAHAADVRHEQEKAIQRWLGVSATVSTIAEVDKSMRNLPGNRTQI
jgi:hypothetical protein